MKETLAKTSSAVAEADDALQLVGFKIAGELFGVDILMVKEIIKDTLITAIPDAPDFIKGVINLRGNIIPIIDLRKRLKLSGDQRESGGEAWVVILEISSRVTGFIVDHVTRVIKVPLQSVQPPPEMVSSGLESDYISGVCKLDEGKLLAILDFNRILVVDEFKKISQLKRQGNK